jgi:O-methyltransferase domain/Dimerisation domain
MKNNASTQVPSSHEQILAMILGFWQSRALAVANDLGLADLLVDGPLHVDDLALRTETHSRSLFRLLRALESVGIFSQVSPSVFANTPSSECLRKGVPWSLAAFVQAELSAGGGMYEAWAGLGGSVRTGGKAFDQIYGYNFWEFCRRNPKAGEVFNEAMSEVRRGTAPVITASYEWNRFSVIADIGGGLGVQLGNILDASPLSRGILFDQPDVMKQAIVHERMEKIGGDLFQHVPSGADVYILNGIIHDWTDSEALNILSTVRQAMKADSRLAVLDEIIPETPQFTFGKWLDLLMLTVPGGRERTEREFLELLSCSGFELEERVNTAASLSILVARARKAS